MRHPGGAVANCVRDVRSHKHSAECNDHDREQPQIPCRDESSEFVKGELRPLVNAAFERHDSAQVNHNGSLRNVEEHNREEPEEEMRLAELRCGADPARADHEKNLRQDQIAETEWFFERDALFLDIAFSAIEFGSHLKGCRGACARRRRRLTQTPLQPFGYRTIDLMFVLFCPYRRRWFISKFAMPNSAPGIGDITTTSQGQRAKQNHCDDEWCSRCRPF